MSHPTRAEIRLGNIIHNLEEIRRKVGPRVKVLAAVKANAYGHGAVAVSKALAAHGVDMLGVAAVSEAAELRDAGIETPILMLGAVLPDLVEDALRRSVALTVCDADLAQAVSETARRLNVVASVHVKIDTGMGRIGVSPDGALDLIRRVLSLGHLSFDGVWTHFPAADEPDLSFARRQVALFNSITAKMKKEGLPVPLRHAANSGAIAQLPEAHFDMVRPGLALYGYHPTADMRLDLDLRPAMTLKTRVSFAKNLLVGATVSYGRTFTAARPTRAATLPIGYADGLNRLLSNTGHVLIHGKHCHIIGRICMDQCVVDITDVPEVQIGDDVVVYGRQGDEMISVESVAKLLGTIPNEVLCAVSRRVPRSHPW
ncbi:MAG: alanine racemase [Planctomycetota bacterium]